MLKFKKNWQLEIYGPVSNDLYFKNILNFISKNNLENEIKVLGSVFNEQKKKKFFMKLTGLYFQVKVKILGSQLEKL